MTADALLSPHAACAVIAGHGLGDNAAGAILRAAPWQDSMGGRYVAQSALDRLIRAHQL